MNFRSVSVIGAGPAGISLAIQLKRFGIGFFLFEKKRVGGLLRNGYLIENYPGFPKGISGENLSDLFGKHLDLLDIDVIYSKVEVVKFDRKKNRFKIFFDRGIYFSDYVVFATGTVPVYPESVDGFSDEIKGNIFFEITELIGLSGKNFLIIGGGDAAFDYALSLSGSNNTTIALRSNKPRALSTLVERVRMSDKSEILSGVYIKSIEHNSDGKLIVSFLGGSENFSIRFDSVIFATGRVSDNVLYTELYRDNNLPDMIKERALIIGDAKNGIFRQVSIAVGDGLKTAMEIYFNMRSS